MLFAVQLIGLLVYPFMEGNDLRRALFSVFGIAVLGLVLLSVRSSPALTSVALVLGIPATVLLLIQAVTTSDDLLPWSSALEAPLYPQSFTAAVDPQRDRSWMELLFLSFTTLTSTGLSDVVPVKAFARSLVMVEQLAGVGYIAMVVSRLVPLLVLNRKPA